MEEFRDWAVLHVAGELDMSSSPLLRSEIISQMNEGRVHIALNLSAVEFIDSTGLGVLLGATKRLRERAGDLKVVEVPERVGHIFEITGLHHSLPLLDSLTDLPIAGAREPERRRADRRRASEGGPHG